IVQLAWVWCVRFQYAWLQSARLQVPGFSLLSRLLCLLFGPPPVLGSRGLIVMDYPAARPRVARSEIPRGFRDLRTVPGSVKDVHFGFRGCSRLGWIKVN